MVTAILVSRGLHEVRYGEEGTIKRMVTAILTDRGPHGTGYGESGVASSGGHIVRSRRLLQTDGDNSSRGARTCRRVWLKERLRGSSVVEKFGGARSVEETVAWGVQPRDDR